MKVSNKKKLMLVKFVLIIACVLLFYMIAGSIVELLLTEAIVPMWWSTVLKSVLWLVGVVLAQFGLFNHLDKRVQIKGPVENLPPKEGNSEISQTDNAANGGSSNLSNN